MCGSCFETEERLANTILFFSSLISNLSLYEFLFEDARAGSYISLCVYRFVREGRFVVWILRHKLIDAPSRL